jgi:hypothetical protein
MLREATLRIGVALLSAIGRPTKKAKRRKKTPLFMTPSSTSVLVDATQAFSFTALPPKLYSDTKLPSRRLQKLRLPRQSMKRRATSSPIILYVFPLA